jgi:hypothetical protein
MKLTTIAIIALTAMTVTLGAQFGWGQQKQWVEDFTVCVGTKTAVMVGGYLPTRKYYAVGNWSSTYMVFHATWALTQADIQGLSSLAIGSSKKGSGIPLAPYLGTDNLNVWKDEYNIYYSSWYVLVSSAGAQANVAPVSANVTYRQRK